MFGVAWKYLENDIPPLRVPHERSVTLCRERGHLLYFIAPTTKRRYELHLVFIEFFEFYGR